MATGVPKIQWDSDPTAVVLTERVVTLARVRALRKRIEYVSLSRSSPDTANRLYWSDNMDALLALREDGAIAGKIRLIYLDPPYATNSVFQSKAMKSAYSDVITGDKYLAFLRERLAILRDLLAEDGSIYVHLDENMVFHVKVMMDEIFGLQNFRSFITRRKCSSKNYTHKTYGDISDYILFYTKGKRWVWNRPVAPWTDEHAEKEYPYTEKETGRRYKRVPLHGPGVRNGPCGQPWRGRPPPPGRHWKTTPEKLDSLDSRGEIYWSAKGNPRKKVYLDKSLGVLVPNLWTDCRDAHNQNIKITGYPTEKSYTILDRIVRASSNRGDLVLDCFAGSGTTLAAASTLGRRWIGMDSSLEAIRTTAVRLVNHHGDTPFEVLAPKSAMHDKTAVAVVRTALIAKS